MEALAYLDIHTHGRKEVDSISVASLSMEEILSESTAHEFSSAGIHPWWLEDVTPEEIEQLKVHVENMVKAGRLWGIGETGFDRAYPEFIEQQKSLFDWHLNLSENFKLTLFAKACLNSKTLSKLLFSSIKCPLYVGSSIIHLLLSGIKTSQTT